MRIQHLLIENPIFALNSYRYLHLINLKTYKIDEGTGFLFDLVACDVCWVHIVFGITMNGFQQDTVEGEKQKIQECGSCTKTEDASKEILFNPNVFTEFKLAGNPEVAYIIFQNFLLAFSSLEVLLKFHLSRR